MALAMGSVVAFVSPAAAATVVDLRGVESFNTDTLLMSLCTGSTAEEYWWINVSTGKAYVDTTNGYPAANLPYPIERFQGSCYYPAASSWTWTGAETQTSSTLVNCGYNTTLSQAIQQNGTTTSTTTNSVTGSVGIDWTAIKDVLSLEAGFQYQHTWSYAKASGWSITTTIAVSPRTVGWLALRPEMRTVRSNPIFHVDKYSWGASGGGQVDSTSWRGRGYNEIDSYGAYYDAVGNVLNSNGQPVGEYVARDRAVTSSDC